MINTPAAQKTSEIFRKYYRPIEPILQKPKNRVYTATVLSFLTVSLFIWYAIRPTIQTILSLRREIRDSTAVNEQMEEKIGSLVEAQSTYQEIVPRLGLLREGVPETPDMVELMVQLRNLANTVDATVSGANFSSIPLTVEKQRPANPGSTTPQAKDQLSNTTTFLTLTIQGTFDQVREFIDGVYSLRRIVTIIDLSLIPQGIDASGKTGGSLTMTLKLNTYSASE